MFRSLLQKALLLAACLTLFSVGVIAQPFVFYSVQNSPNLNRANIDGTAQISIFNGTVGDEPLDIEFDDVMVQVYFSTFNGDIWRSDPGGLPTNIIIPTGGAGVAIAVDGVGGKIYWIDGAGQTINRANLDGTGIENLIPSGLAAPYDIEVDPQAGYIYWSDSSFNTIERANLDGTGRVTIWPGLNNPQGIAIEKGTSRILWAEPLTPGIFEGNLDGSGTVALRQLTPGGANPNRVAVDPTDGRVFWTDESSVTTGLYRTDLANPSVPDQLVPGSIIPFEGVAIFQLCGAGSLDSDNDGIADCGDGCPADPAKTAAGVCGCGLADTDTDGDATLDCVDLCPADDEKIAPGVCGCGAFDNDPDGSGTIVCGAAPILSPTTVLDEPPEVVTTGGSSVTLQLQAFDSASINGGTQNSVAIARASNLSVRYNITVRKRSGERFTKLTKRNRVTFRNLRPGSYTARYRAEIVRGNGSVASRTNRSPNVTFSISR